MGSQQGVKILCLKLGGLISGFYGIYGLFAAQFFILTTTDTTTPTHVPYLSVPILARAWQPYSRIIKEIWYF